MNQEQLKHCDWNQSEDIVLIDADLYSLGHFQQITFLTLP